MEEKKISFGFSKVMKPNILPSRNYEKIRKNNIEFIEMIEGQKMKVIG